MQGKAHPALLALTAILLSIVGTLIVAEIVLRFLPVNEGLRAQPVDAANPIFRFQPNRTSTWSEGWNFESVNRVHVNNDGFINDQDYDPSMSTPLLAIVGDSYIEAGMVPFPETIGGRLAADLRGRGRVYTFAASGAGLPQYLVWADYARRRYHPDAFVINIIANDFDESLWHRGQSPGFHHFQRMPDGTAVLRRVDYQPSFWRLLLRHSALAMYLITNMKVQQLLNFSVQSLGANDKRWSSNIPYESSEIAFADYRWAVDSFLDALPAATGVDADRIVLVFDALRPDMYDPVLLPEAERGTWGVMRAYVMQQARTRGIGTVDLQPVFAESYAREHRRFEFPHDGHWNGLGHELAAQAIERAPMYGRFRNAALKVE
ncbi:MAG: hypothetical protein ACYC1L_08945 [Alphaproteobacteria bacterium]